MWRLGLLNIYHISFSKNYNLSASVALKPRLETYFIGQQQSWKEWKNSSFDLSVNAALDVGRVAPVILEAATKITGEHNGQEFDLAFTTIYIRTRHLFFWKPK